MSEVSTACGQRTPHKLPRWVAPVLALPALIPVARAYLACFHGKIATGFISYDMPYYMANAREHFDQGFQLTYGNPYASYGTPAIYFQPQTLLLGLLQHLGLDPGLVFNLFGLVTLFFAAYVAVRFFDEVVGLQTRARLIGLVCFFWGGGTLCLAGLTSGLLQHQGVSGSLLKFDIFDGWWMFNFGRNLTYPTEAYYHGVFLLSLLCLMRRKFAWSLALAMLLSLSHPFSGLSLALILVAYPSLELTLRSKAVPPLFLAGSIAILSFHLTYYLWFLNRFSDHRALRSQWDLAWLYEPSAYLPALLIVGVLAAARLIRRPGLLPVVKDNRVRLFIVWFLVVFALSQHNLIVRPIQPVHFAHGYDWIALFFLGYPVLLSITDRLLSIRRWPLRYATISALVTFVLLDNLLWYGSFLLQVRGSPSSSISLTYDQKAVLDWLSRNAKPPDMVVCQDEMVSYLVSTYTPVRSWLGHWANTPDNQKRKDEVQQEFLYGRTLPEWQRMHILYINERSNNWSPPLNTVELYQNREYAVWGPR